ncbi:MAG: hypothetical protein ACI8XB_002534 [Patiriisocius sp.]|jgi:hypothetical protein
MKKIVVLILLSHSFIGAGQVRLNEMQSANGTTLADGFGEYDDWIEIHNPTAISIEIGGLVLKDQLDTWVIPTGDLSTNIPAGGYFLLWADDQEIQGIFHTNFKLASGGEFLGLYAVDGVTVIDSVTLPSMNPDLSFIRCEFGWEQTVSPTPLADNNCIVSVGEITPAEEAFSIVSNANGTLIIDLIDYASGEYHLVMYSVDGKKIIDRSLTAKKTTLNPQLLDGGIYIAVVSAHNTISSKRIWIRN